MEEVDDAEIIEQVGDARAGIEQLDASVSARVGFFGELETQARHDAEERAVHQLTVGEVEDEASGAPVPQFDQGRFEIDTALEIRPSADADDDHAAAGPDGKVRW